MPRHTLEGYYKYDQAKVRRPESAALAKELFDHCYASHLIDGEQIGLRWPEPAQKWIISDPNYYAFSNIAVHKTSVLISIYPLGQKNYIGESGLTAQEADSVDLKDAVDKETGGAKQTRFKVTDQVSLKIAKRILDEAFRLSKLRLQAKMRR